MTRNSPLVKPANALLHGLDALILKTLTSGPRHGYAIARFLEEATSESVLIEDGSLYPARYRLERRGWVEAEWGTSELGRRAKLYRITDAGRDQLAAETAAWRRFSVSASSRSTSRPLLRSPRWWWWPRRSPWRAPHGAPRMSIQPPHCVSSSTSSRADREARPEDFLERVQEGLHGGGFDLVASGRLSRRTRRSLRDVRTGVRSKRPLRLRRGLARLRAFWAQPGLGHEAT